MKKDIWAAFTFLATGVLSYLAQVEAPSQKVLPSDDECGVVETVGVEENASDTPEELFFRNLTTRDS